MDLGLRDRTAFVAAASRGLGRGVAIAFAAEGSDVGMCARDTTALDGVARAVEGHGRTAVPVAADLTDPAAITAAIETTVARTGRLDALVVNAGGPPPGDFETLDDTAWHAAVELTLMSAVRLIRAALPALRRSDAASVLILGSTSTERPIGGLLLSNALRSAVAGLARTLATELAPGVRVNAILTGRIRTARTEELARHRHHDEDVDAVLAREAEQIPARRFGTVEELARVAVFLSSPAASYVSGASVAVDGGLIQAV